MKRREFITLLGGAAAAWPLAARAQQPSACGASACSMMPLADDPEAQSYVTAFQQGMQRIGLESWDEIFADRHCAGRGDDADRWRRYAAELVALSPDVIVAAGGPIVGADASRRPAPSRSCSRNAIDPVGAGFVESLARPGGNVTGFTQFEYGLGGKWLELLKEIAPG